MVIASRALILLALASSVISFLVPSSADEGFDVRQHLSTVTRYGASKEAYRTNYTSSVIPEGCTPIHLNLVARHGTRSPTKKRIKELDHLASRLDALLKDAVNKSMNNLQRTPSWLRTWKSPWNGRKLGGELVGIGEEELYNLAIRIRERYPELFEERYHPDIYSIRATQVPRASASAVAFGMGLFSGNGTLGLGKQRAFSVISESRASDICLRFFDSCETYKEYRKSQEPAVEKLKEPILNDIASSLAESWHLNFTAQDISSLWFLCKQEASLLGITDQACGLFNPSEVFLLEWTDDVEVFLLKGYGKSINYRMGVPLLNDVLQSMEQAILVKEENQPSGTFEKVRLRFAHAETVVPFTCLLGLFLEGSEFEQIQSEHPLPLPPKPPKQRTWWGSTVAPFGGNNILVLYQCPLNNETTMRLSGGHKSKYFVQVLHNEVATPIPGCGNSDFCPFEVFKEKIVEPHLKHDFNLLCRTKPPGVNLVSSEPCSFACKLSLFLRRLFLLENSYPEEEKQDTEL